jgi:hypothetical protein
MVVEWRSVLCCVPNFAQLPVYVQRRSALRDGSGVFVTWQGLSDEAEEAQWPAICNEFRSDQIKKVQYNATRR